jgi:hypothetical protein
MILNIVNANAWQKPIYFSQTVSRNNFMGLTPYLRLEGMVYRIMPHQVTENEQIDLPRTLYMLDHLYRYRSISRPQYYADETSESILGNYAMIHMHTAMALRQVVDYTKGTIDNLEKQVASIKSVDSVSTLQKELNAEKIQYAEMVDEAITLMDRSVTFLPLDQQARMLRHDLLIHYGKFKEAKQRAEQALLLEPDNGQYQQMLQDASRRAMAVTQ